MAEGGGGGDQNKVTITLDLATGQFMSNINGVQQAIEQTSTKGVNAFEEMGKSMLYMNSTVELIAKVLEKLKEAVESSLNLEKIHNQAIALSNLSGQIGVDSQEIVKAIQAATNGTVTSLEATQAGFKLLNSGIRADAIPTIAEWAKKVELASGGQKKFDETIQNVAKAIETGSMKTLRDYNLILTDTGTTSERLRSVLNQMAISSKNLGDGYEDATEKMEVRSAELWRTLTTPIKGGIRDFLINMSGDTGDRAALQLKNMKEQLTHVNDEMTKGTKVMDSSFLGIAKGFIPITEVRAILEERITKSLEDQNKEGKESEAQAQKLKDSLGSGHIIKPLTPQEIMRAELEGRVLAYEKLDAMDIQANEAAVKHAQELLKAKQDIIGKEFEDKRQVAEATINDADKLAQKLADIEVQRLAAMEALQISQEQAKRTRREVELSMMEQGQMREDAGWQAHQNIRLQIETEAFDKEMELIRLRGDADGQYKSRVETEERAHQERIKKIKDSYNEVNAKNFRFGLNQAFKDMNNQFGNFAAITQRTMAKTHTIMANSFIESAKGHGDVMELMKKQFLEMIGTEMVNSGTFHLLQGIATGNPAEMGAGGALIAAGMALIGASGGGGASADTVGGSAGGAGGGASAGATASGPAPAQGSDLERKHATITIMGDYMNSRETQTHLAEVLRNNSDITDYAIVAQGKSF